jgi:OPA family glycerol-3-phosphate transporter-like MFS transporter 1/2
MKAVRRKLTFLKARAFALTFLSYAVYSGTRQAFGITKETLNPDSKHPDVPGYAPFNDKEWGSTYIGATYTVFLAAYAVGLFITGPLGDRLNLRVFLGIGMLASGFFCFAFGFAEVLGVHHLAWFIAANLGFGLFQATGWPGCVTLITRWFGQGNRGTIMGVWNAHASIGNICCKLAATALLSAYGWHASFMGMGGLLAAVGLLQLLFVVPHPHDVLSRAELAELTRINSSGLIAKVAEEHAHAHQAHPSSAPPLAHVGLAGTDHHPPHADDALSVPLSAPAVPMHDDASRMHLTVGVDVLPSAVAVAAAAPQSPRHHDEYEEISFLEGLLVPGVLEYSACLFFSKLVAYAFSFWLPSFLTSLHYSDTESVRKQLRFPTQRKEDCNEAAFSKLYS